MDVDLLTEARAELAESPVWAPSHHALLWVDQLAGTVHRTTLDGEDETILELSQRVGCVTPRVDGGLLLGTASGFLTTNADDENLLLAVPAVSGPIDATGTWFLNDGKCDAHGNFWAGSIVLDRMGNPTPGTGALHRLAPNGDIVPKIRDLTAANGLGWSPDGDVLYLVDSRRGIVDAFAFDVHEGIVGPPRTVVAHGDPPAVALDGLSVDVDGCLWIAVWGGREVRRYTPGGRLDRTLTLPVTRPTSCTFAGDRLDVLVITTAWHGLSADERAREPLAGALLCCSPGVRGAPTYEFGAPG